MTDKGASAGLRTIFFFFLGLMFTAFVGVGVHTFHPPPDRYDAQFRELTQREQGIRGSRPSSELTAAEHEQIEEINRQRRELSEAAEESQKEWALSTSMVLIVFSTIALVVSLVRADQLQVISNGLLLGGVFTMLYGVGWIVFTGTSVLRFVVMTIALVITLGLGYVRFVRGSAVPRATGQPETPKGEGLAEIERRVRDLEGRMNEAAQALGQKRDVSGGA